MIFLTLLRSLEIFSYFLGAYVLGKRHETPLFPGMFGWRAAQSLTTVVAGNLKGF